MRTGMSCGPGRRGREVAAGGTAVHRRREGLGDLGQRLRMADGRGWLQGVATGREEGLSPCSSMGSAALARYCCACATRVSHAVGGSSSVSPAKRSGSLMAACMRCPNPSTCRRRTRARRGRTRPAGSTGHRPGWATGSRRHCGCPLSGRDRVRHSAAAACPTGRGRGLRSSTRSRARLDVRPCSWTTGCPPSSLSSTDNAAPNSKTVMGFLSCRCHRTKAVRPVQAAEHVCSQ